MEISNGLLVAIMFVLILGIGIATILASLAALLHDVKKNPPDVLLVSWLLLILLAHFNLFWHTVDLLAVEEWWFSGFLYIVTGPILIFFATSLMAPDPGEAHSIDQRGHYFAVSRRFFVVLGLLQLWIFGADTWLGSGADPLETVNLAVTLVLVLVLALSSSQRMHLAGVGLAWVLFLAAMTLRSLAAA